VVDCSESAASLATRSYANQLPTPSRTAANCWSWLDSVAAEYAAVIGRVRGPVAARS